MDNIKIFLENGVETLSNGVFYVYNSKYYYMYTLGEKDDNPDYIKLYVVQVCKEVKNTESGPAETGYMLGLEISDSDEWKNVQGSVAKIVEDKKNNSKNPEIQYLPKEMLLNLKIVSKNKFKLLKQIVEENFKVVLPSTIEPTSVTVVEATPVAAVEPTPVAVVEATSVAPVEPTPVAVVEATSVAPVEPTPVAVVEPTSVAPVEPTPVAVVEATPVAPVEPTPVAVVEATPVVAVEPTPVAVVEATPVAAVEPTEQLNNSIFESQNTLDDDNMGDVIIDYRSKFFEEQEKNASLEEQIKFLTEKLENIKNIIG